MAMQQLYDLLAGMKELGYSPAETAQLLAQITAALTKEETA